MPQEVSELWGKPDTPLTQVTPNSCNLLAICHSLHLRFGMTIRFLFEQRCAHTFAC